MSSALRKSEGRGSQEQEDTHYSAICVCVMHARTNEGCLYMGVFSTRVVEVCQAAVFLRLQEIRPNLLFYTSGVNNEASGSIKPKTTFGFNLRFCALSLEIGP